MGKKELFTGKNVVNPVIDIKNLEVTLDNGSKVLQDLNLTVYPGQIHVIMGPNGSGKSSCAYTLMGHPRYAVTNGEIYCDGQLINDLPPHKRAKMGLFLALQNPYEVEGVPYKDFLRQSYNALYDGTDRQLRIRDFHAMLLGRLEQLKMDQSFIDRSVNVGFSGGEKKRAEMLQLAVLQPRVAILDEIDSGLDVDALRIVCQMLLTVRRENPSMAIILITHYQRIFDYIKPDVVHIMQHGAIVRTGDEQLCSQIDREGFVLPESAR